MYLVIFFSHCDWRSKEKQKQSTKKETLPAFIRCLTLDATGTFLILHFTKLIHMSYGHKGDSVSNILILVPLHIQQSTLHIYFIHTCAHTHTHLLKALRDPLVKKAN